MGDHTTGRVNARRNLIAIAGIETPLPSDSLSDSSNATVKGEIVIAPTAIETAAVTLEPGPYAVVSNGSATAAELGKPTVNASTEASEMGILRPFLAQT